MADAFTSEHVSRLAEDFAKENNATEYPINLSALCEKLDISLLPLSDQNSPSGMLIHERDNFTIAYVGNTGNDGFERFCIAHELAHYALPGHCEAIFKTGSTHESRAGFISELKYEREADIFAASLLMPKSMFQNEISRLSLRGVSVIKKIADQFSTSILSTAIRFISLTSDPAALIVSSKQSVDYCFMSSSFKDLKGLSWIRKNEPLPRDSRTFQFNLDEKNISECRVEEDSSCLSVWFSSRKEIEVSEDIIGLGRTGKTMTLLYDVVLPDEDEIDDDELEKSWTPKFRS